MAKRTIFWSSEPENIAIRSMLRYGPQNYTSIGEKAIQVRWYDNTMYSDRKQKLCHRYRSCEFLRVIKQYAIRKNDLSKKAKMLQTNRQTLRKNASKTWHFFLISRLESRACEAMYTEKICRLKFNRLFEESWTESKIGESLVRFQWLLENSRKKSTNF